MSKPFADVNLDNFYELVKACGATNTVIAQGETGIGKSYVLSRFKKEFGDKYTYIYLDCTTKEAGDLAMPKIYDLDGRFLLDFVPSKELGLHLDKPCIVMVDEIGKTSRPVQNVLCRFIYERKVGEFSLHPDSIVFATTNLADEGFGDNMPAYMRNRAVVVTVRKPSAEEWIEGFAIANDVHPTVMQTVSEKPDMLASYRDYIGKKTGDQNPYIYDPNHPKQAFVTPRSLALASNLLKATEHLTPAVRQHMLAGQIGEVGAADMMAMNELFHKLPRYGDIVKTPSKAQLPEGGGAACMLVYTMIQNVEKEHVPSVMTYVERMAKEAQALFCKGMLKREKAAMIAAERAFLDWTSSNAYLFRDNS